MLLDWGSEQKYVHVLKGYNYRMENIQGAVLRVKLNHLEAWTEARRAHARGYNTHIDNLGLARPVSERDGERHVYHVYAVRVRERDRVRQAMVDAEIAAGIHYPMLCICSQLSQNWGTRAAISL